MARYTNYVSSSPFFFCCKQEIIFFQMPGQIPKQTIGKILQREKNKTKIFKKRQPTITRTNVCFFFFFRVSGGYVRLKKCLNFGIRFESWRGSNPLQNVMRGSVFVVAEKKMHCKDKKKTFLATRNRRKRPRKWLHGNYCFFNNSRQGSCQFVSFLFGTARRFRFGSLF